MRHQAGFSLIELIVIIVILGVISVSAAGILIESFIGNTQTNTFNQVVQPGQYALNKISSDVSGITDNTSTNMLTATANDLKFINNNNTIEYVIAGNTITQSINGATAVLFLDHVSNASFTYLDKTGASGATIPNIDYVSISITRTIGTTAMTFTQTVFLRNALA